MNKRVKKMWLEALRSGKYKQGRFVLSSTNTEGQTRFCCLGVLCDLYKIENGKIDWHEIREKKIRAKEILGSMNYLPSIIASWAELIIEQNDQIDPRVEYREREVRLSELNDNKVSFETIADIIEEQL